MFISISIRSCSCDGVSHDCCMVPACMMSSMHAEVHHTWYDRHSWDCLDACFFTLSWQRRAAKSRLLVWFCFRTGTGMAQRGGRHAGGVSHHCRSSAGLGSLWPWLQGPRGTAPIPMVTLTCWKCLPRSAFSSAFQGALLAFHAKGLTD